MADDNDNYPSFDDALPCEQEAADSNLNSHLGGTSDRHLRDFIPGNAGLAIKSAWS